MSEEDEAINRVVAERQSVGRYFVIFGLVMAVLLAGLFYVNTRLNDAQTDIKGVSKQNTSLAAALEAQRQQFIACKNVPASTAGCSTPVAVPASAAGPRGAQGIQGFPGIGIQGVQGIQGIEGQAGLAGAVGAAGGDGLNGKDGTNGTNGLDGKNGVDGKDGKDGTNGVNGSPGVVDVSNGCQVVDGEYVTNVSLTYSGQTITINCTTAAVGILP